jgi:hypothetical protein
LDMLFQTSEIPTSILEMLFHKCKTVF